MGNSSGNTVAEGCLGYMLYSKVKGIFQIAYRWKSGYSIDFKKFASYDEIVKYLESAGGRLMELGLTEEKRRILALRVGEGPTCILEAGVHAREWASPMAALYVISRLLTAPAQGVTWIVIPLLNPDGYEYSRNHKRMWRKNKRKIKGSSCQGVDINRNFKSHWGKVGGCSRDPCSDIYCGPEAWSEPETRAVRDLVAAETDIRVYLSVHSCLQAIMYPPAYTIKPPPDLIDLEDVAIQAQESILNNCGTFYVVGQSSIIDRIASGASIDWVRDSADIKYTFNFELRGPDTGFRLPENEVELAGKELFEAVKVFSRIVRENKDNLKEK